jgi:hypothetical protein
MRHAGKIVVLLSVSAALYGGTQANYDPAERIWNLSNGQIAASFQLTPEGHFLTRQISDPRSGDSWTVSAERPTTPVRLQTETATFDASTTFDLISQSAEPVRNGMRQSIVLADLMGRGRFTVVFEMYDDQPVLRYYLRFLNQRASTAYVTSVNMTPWTFADSGSRYAAMRVSQWSVLGKSEDFQPTQILLDTGGATFEVNSGSAGDQCGWLAVRDSAGRGLFAG